MTHSPHSWCWLALSRGVWVSMRPQFPHSLCHPPLSSLRLLEFQFHRVLMIHQLYSRGLLTLFNFLSLIFFSPLILSLNTSARGKRSGEKPKWTIQFKLSTALSWVHFVLNVQFVFQLYGLSSLRFFSLKSPGTLHIVPRLDTQDCLFVGAKWPLLFFPWFLVVVRLDTLS